MSLPSIDRPAPLRAGGALAAGLLRRLLPDLESGQITIITPAGNHVVLQGREPGEQATIVLRRWRALHRLLIGGDLGFAEAYIDGDWSSPDLLGLLDLLTHNAEAVDRKLRGMLPVRLVHRLRHLLNANTPRGSRRNISFHYDLGNAFYALWLDPQMIYSSALYRDASETLEQAQEAKLDRIVELLSPAEGDAILEIGCGWGALALRLAQRRARVTGLTLSTEQLAWALDRARHTDAAERCAFELKDYRKAAGRFDRIVSIEMLEAVGERYWPTYFGKLRELLAPHGTAVIQVITIDEKRFEHYRRHSDFIQRHVFPGGMLPTGAAIAREAAAAGLEVVGRETFGDSYARTLEEWRRRFLRAWPTIQHLGVDLPFRRLWDYYLCYCAAGFRAGAIDVGLYTLRPKAA
ncbi:MAG: class I SAM-dependent methyltransferase [Reyranellales bacterium]